MIYCVGVGPGDLEHLTQRGYQLISQAQIVAGFDAVINVITPIISADAIVIPMGYNNQVEQLDMTAKWHNAGKRCVVAFMGDVHFSGFQFLERVEQACGHQVETVPGISSAQILASRARVCFDDTSFISFHRRGDIDEYKCHVVHALGDHRNVILLPRPWDFMPKDIAHYLIEHSISPQHVTEVWERLTQGEAEWRGLLGECTQKEFSDMSIMLIRRLNSSPKQLQTVVNDG